MYILPILCCIYFVSNLLFYKNNSIHFCRKINWFYYIIFIAIIGFQLFNAYNFLTDNFIFNSVYVHSEKKLDMFYKIAASFSGKEGSFLLWLTSVAFVGIFFNKHINKIFSNSKNTFLHKAIFILFPLFLSIALFFNNPFELVSKNIDLTTTNITDGLGLKPTLQSYYNIDLASYT